MRTGFALAAAMFALLGSDQVVDAKNTYLVKEEITTKEHVRPRVENTTERCAYDTISFRLCGKYGATASLGWEWEQEFYSLA